MIKPRPEKKGRIRTGQGDKPLFAPSEKDLKPGSKLNAVQSLVGGRNYQGTSFPTRKTGTSLWRERTKPLFVVLRSSEYSDPKGLTKLAMWTTSHLDNEYLKVQIYIMIYKVCIFSRASSLHKLCMKLRLTAEIFKVFVTVCQRILDTLFGVNPPNEL